jgi:hypothetical protein
VKQAPGACDVYAVILRIGPGMRQRCHMDDNIRIAACFGEECRVVEIPIHDVEPEIRQVPCTLSGAGEGTNPEPGPRECVSDVASDEASRTGQQYPGRRRLVIKLCAGWPQKQRFRFAAPLRARTTDLRACGSVSTESGRTHVHPPFSRRI